MGWIFDERPKSGDFTTDPDTITLKYVVGPHGDENYVMQYLLAATPLIYKDLFRQPIKAKHIGAGLFHADVPYGELQPPDPSIYQISYDTAGGTAHITQAKEHIDDWWAPDVSETDHKGAINVKEDFRAEGTDIIVGAFRWTEEHTFPVSQAGWPYSQILKALTGKVNDRPFRGFDAWQVLFEGASGSYSSAADVDDEIQLTYTFVQNDDITGVTYDRIDNVSKIGWQYIWFEHEAEDDEIKKALPSRLAGVHVERLYDEADFRWMQLPGESG